MEDDDKMQESEVEEEEEVADETDNVSRFHQFKYLHLPSFHIMFSCLTVDDSRCAGSHGIIR